MQTFECQTSIPEVSGLENGKMTVGRHMLLSCKGSSSESFDFSKAAFAPEAKNLIQLFSLKSQSADAFAMDVTLYTTGKINLSDYKLTDGVNEIVLNAAPITVESVLKQPEDGKPQEPFGPILPIPINIPQIYYLYLAAVVLLTALYLFLKARRLRYYRKLKNNLSQYQSPIDPESQFYRAIRTAEKEGYPLPELEKAFRLYGLRSYKLPLFELSNDRVIKYFKRNYPEFKETRIQLQKLLGEFEMLGKNPAVDSERKSELVKKMYKFVDHHKGISHE